MKRPTWPWILLTVAALAVIAAAYQANRAQPEAGSTPQSTSPTAQSRALESPLVGRPAPAIRLEQLGGGQTDLASLRGKAVLVSFWSTY